MEVVDDVCLHKLNSEWCLWTHLPHDQIWSIDSYKNIYKFNTIEECKSILELLTENLIKNCMLFIMRNDIQPIWEDKKNINGGSYSYKILNKEVKDFWINLTYYLIGETLLNDNNIELNITGISVSPKKNFCIIKIWVDNCNYDNINIINKKLNIKDENCIFKKHIQ